MLEDGVGQLCQEEKKEGRNEDPRIVVLLRDEWLEKGVEVAASGEKCGRDD